MPVALLVASGLLEIFSINAHLALLQLLWIAAGAGIMLLLLKIDYRTILARQWVTGGIYFASIALLAWVVLWGPVIRGTRSWIVLGPFHVQPSEFAKFALILFLSQYLRRRHYHIAQWRTIFGSFAAVAVPGALIALQPDFGSALVLGGIWFGMLLASGLPRARVFLFLLLFAAAAVALWHVGLQPYQKERILGVLFPARDPLGVNYSTIQSKIAIGSAGWWGKGFRQGSQTQLGFLPEPTTDFIFAAFVEEWGWIAGILLLSLFGWLFWKTLRIAMVSGRSVEQLACYGAVVMWGWQFFINVGSALGIFPVVGVPLPFVSYGGSNLLTNFALVSIIAAIDWRK